MTGQPPSLADWLQMLCLAVAVFEACSVPFFLIVDADPCDFDPRPAARRLLLSRPVDRVLATPSGCWLLLAWPRLKTAAGDACRDAAALFLLLTTSPKGALS